MSNFGHFFKTQPKLILEGGAGGHIYHPFDLPQVKNGMNLYNLFVKTANELANKPANLKMDGINISIRLITNPQNKKEFVIDRGSQKLEDLQGVTINKLTSRFPNNPGLLKVAMEVLSIFNSIIPHISAELETLGMVSDSNIFFNMEYIKGQTNVINYDANYLVIHGLKKFVFTTTPVRNQPTRAIENTTYSKEDLTKLVQKAAPFILEHGFTLINELPTTLKKKPNFGKVLAETVTIRYTDTESESKPLSVWLSKVNNPGDRMISATRGKIKAINKQLYVDVIVNHRTLQSALAEREDEMSNVANNIYAVEGVIMYHATRMLGRELLSCLSSPLGDVEHHEGIIIDNPKIAPEAFKITGDFIVTSYQSPFRKQ